MVMTNSAGGFRLSGSAIRSFAIGHPAADGHFPGNPIIPGAVLLREIVSAISATQETVRATATGCQVRSAKFHRPVRPGDTLAITWIAGDGGEIRFSGSIAGSVSPAVSGLLRVATP